MKKGVCELSGYKRFVSYMYRYVQGDKRDNVGYARIENYNDKCKITIHIKELKKQDEEASVYLFHREKDKLEGIYLNKIIFNKGIGEFQDTTNSQKIVNSSYDFSDISGIIIYVNKERFWGTEWDGSPIDITQFQIGEEKLVFAANVNETDIQKLERQFFSFTRVYPFVDEQVQCIGVEPNNLSDIHSTWNQWEDNDFLLHGYGRFRHILVGRQPKEKEYEYFLGIPGIYRDEEERIANKYGFKQFIPRGKENAQYGDFGYWCANVTI